MRWDVRARLIEVARNRETITYGQLMKEFRIPRGHPTPGIGIGWVVGEISEYEHSEGRPFLSVIVVKAGSETRICPKGHPGGGFFSVVGLPPHLKRDTDEFSERLTIEEQNFVKEEQERVWDYWTTHEDGE
ncbi:MAG: hypothetical protein GXP27_08330 [Planctomycetes bacterium]|nr:hypothetical protein [Planctomycetota bacterium]